MAVKHQKTCGVVTCFPLLHVYQELGYIFVGRTFFFIHKTVRQAPHGLGFPPSTSEFEVPNMEVLTKKSSGYSLSNRESKTPQNRFRYQVSCTSIWSVPDSCERDCTVALVHHLEDHPRTCKWLITMVIVCPLTGVVGPLPNGLNLGNL